MITRITIDNKKLLTTTLLLIALAITLSFTIQDSSAATISVGNNSTGTDNATTIQGGINLAQANDTVIVHNKGTNYTENVAINKAGLTVKSGTGENVTVQTNGGTAFSISNTNGITIQGFTIQSNSQTTGTGISILGIYGSNNTNILYNIFQNINIGVSISSSSNNIISNNSFYNTTTAINLGSVSGRPGANNNTVSYNNITNPSYNPTSQVRYGIKDTTAGSLNQNNKYLNNNISHVSQGIYIQQGNITISGNNITIVDAPNIPRAILLSFGSTADQVNIISNNIITSEGKTGVGSIGIYLSSSSPVNANLQIYSNSITNFTTGIWLSLYNPTGTPVTQIYLNRFYNNTQGLVMSSSNTLVNATNNWWGKNDTLIVSTSATPPATYDIWYNAGTLIYNPWLVLTVSANPTSIHGGETSTVTADLTKNSDGVDTTTLYGGKTVLNGIPVNFSFQGAPLGTLSVNSAVTANGQAVTTFTANAAGTSHIYATVDGQTVGTNVNISLLTAATVNPVTGYKGDTVNLIATLTDTYNNAPVAGKTVNFTVNGHSVGSATTDASGVATLSYTILEDAGSYTILAEFLGDSNYLTSSNTSTLTVNHIPTAIVVNPVTGHKGDSVNLIATLTDTHNNVPLAGKTVNFTVNGHSVGTATTNASGVATLAYTILEDAGSYTILAEFVQDTVYAGSSNTTTLTVNHIPTAVAVNPVTGHHGDLVNLVATLTDTHNNLPVSGKIVNFTVNGVSAGSAITDASGVATLFNYLITQNVGSYTILAEFVQDTVYAGSSNTSTLTVNGIPTSLTVDNVIGNKGQTVDLKATLVDTAHGNTPISGKTVTFTVNGVPVGSAVTDANGIATLSYFVDLVGGIYNIDAQFAADNIYMGSTGTGTLKVPQSSIYVITTASKNNPTVGETITLNFKLGNNGPDTAQNVVFTYVLPEGLELVNITGDGTYSYDAATRTITWNLGNVPVGDPWLYVQVKVLKAGAFDVNPQVRTITYDPTLGSNVQFATINAVEPVNAASETNTIPMQPTGLPFSAIIAAILMVIGGIVVPKRK